MADPDRSDVAAGRVHGPGLFAAFRTRRAAAERTAAEGRAVVEPDPRIEEKARRDAYERGRRDERARHRGSPLLAFLMLIIAMAGGTMVYLAAREGSFAAGGNVIDRTLNRASAPAKSAAGNAGAALESAGRNLKENSGSSPS